jgi:hypothetical protein
MKNRLIKKILPVVTIIILSWQPSISQTNEKDGSVKIIRMLVDHYRHAGNLSFGISFKYSDSERPDHVIDSLSGSFKISDSLYWYDLDNTECVFDSRHMVMLFKEDKLMYLTRPSRSLQNVLPINMLDSLLESNKEIHSSVYNGKGYTKLTIDFPKDHSYQKIEYTIDTRTGYLMMVKAWVRSAELYDPSVRSVVNKNSYAIIQTNYFNYRKDAFDKSVFDLKRYYKEENGQYKAVSPFDAYTVFVATPNF